MGNKGSKAKRAAKNKDKDEDSKSSRASTAATTNQRSNTSATKPKPNPKKPQVTTSTKKKEKPEKMEESEIDDPNPGKSPLERLLWEIRLSEYYKGLAKAGFDNDLKKITDKAKDEDGFENMCSKVGMKAGHIHKLRLALLDSSYP
eukprot:jgi/Bigna1/87949/estExt_fgenesh1_pg.C_260068